MKIEYITNASFVFHLDDGRRILTDPWYTDGIYHGALFNFPPINAERKQGYLQLQPDYLYISHLHGDHFDPKTLAHYPRNTPLLIGKFPVPALRNALAGLGFTDVRELPFDELVTVDGIEICIFRQFSGSSDNIDNKTDVPVDTSIYIHEPGGHSVFFAVDNPIQLANARHIADQFGPLDVAVLPYTGASVYPYVFTDYDDEDKLRRSEALVNSRLLQFCKLADCIEARFVIPAAGSFVLGGPIADYARFQYQAPPGRIVEFWNAQGRDAGQLKILATGDCLDPSDGAVAEAEDTLYRDYTQQERAEYATSLAGFPCDLDEIAMPGALYIPWYGMVNKARKALWTQQEVLKTRPAADVDIVIKATDQVHLNGEPEIRFRIPLDEGVVSSASEASENRYWIRFTMPANLMLALLLGITYWNVGEYFMQIERRPDEFDPTIRTLMGFFRL